MAEETFTTAVLAIKLMKNVIVLTSNRKRYPVKWVQLVKRIQNSAMDIYEFIMEANRLDIRKYKANRIKLQTRAITTCDKLSCYIEMSMEFNLIGSVTANRIQKQINDVKYNVIAWRNSDESR